MDSGGMSTAACVHHRANSSGGSCGSSAAPPAPPNMQAQQHPANGNGGGGGGSRMAVIGVTRNVKLRRRGAAGFGFSLRGGREYAAGFYVSDVVPGGEAHSHGLRVGDQILRVNGYPVEDAVHQEVALLAKNQQVLVLKIRSVGMIPVKDNPNDPVTWHMVQQQQQQLQFGDAVTNEIRIRVVLGEKGRLGCGVCRGLVPGLTVQGTREGGPARAAGLRAGDVVTWCNGQSLTDLPFERAIESMRNAQVLDLLVNRPIVPSPNAQPTANHVYDCPEALWMRGSSGYDSESSSLLGSPQHRAQTNACNRNLRNCCPPNSATPSDWGHVEQSQEWMRKANNTTVIRIGPQQQQMPHQQLPRRGPPPPLRRSGYDDEPIYDPVAPRDFECHDFDANPRDELDRRAEYRREHGIREVGFEDLYVKENGQPDGGSVVLNGGKPNAQIQAQQQQQNQQPERKTVTTVEVHQPSPPAPPSMPYKWPAEGKPMNAMGVQMGSTMSMGSTGSTETESSLESSCGGKDNASTSSTSSDPPTATQPPPSFATSIAAACAQGAGAKVQERGKAVKVPPPPPPPPIDLGSAIAQELQRRKQRHASHQDADKTEAARGQARNPEATRAHEHKVTHDKLMEEFKRAHQRMFSNAQQRNQTTEQNNTEQSRPAGCPPAIPKKPASLLAKHSTAEADDDDDDGDDKHHENAKKADESVEMRSIESFRLKDPATSAPVPKPPQTYFPSPAKASSTPKTVVRIGTYNGDADSRQPARLGFLARGAVGGAGGAASSRLRSELAATLLRSNLRGENESAHPTEESANKSSSGQQDANVDKLAGSLNNKVTIRVTPEASGTR